MTNRYSGRYQTAIAGRSRIAMLGAIVGGLIGNQFGHGRGRDAATLAGAALGHAVASDAANNCDAGYRSRGYRSGSYGGYYGYPPGISIRIGSGYRGGYAPYYYRSNHGRRHRNW